MKEWDDTSASRFEKRALQAELRAGRAEERAERARGRLLGTESAEEHEQMVRHVMAHEFAAEGQRRAARHLRQQARG